MRYKDLENTSNRFSLENLKVKNNNVLVLHFYDVTEKESGVLSHFFNKRLSCLISSRQNDTYIFLITDGKIDVSETKIKIYKDTKNNYIEKSVKIYQTGDKVYIDTSKSYKIKYANKKRINRSVSLPKFIRYLEQINLTSVKDIYTIINYENMLYQKKEEVNFMTEKDYYGVKVYTFKKFIQYYGKNINEINMNEVISKLKQSKRGDRNVMFFYAVFYYKIIENIYSKYSIDLGFSEDYKHLLDNVIQEIFLPDEKENIKICKYILHEYKFKKIDKLTQYIYNSVIKNLQNYTGVSLKLYSYDKNNRLYYYHDFKNPDNKNRFLIVKTDNKTQIFSSYKDISHLIDSHSFVKIYNTKNEKYYYIMRIKSKTRLIRIINGVRVYPEKYVVVDNTYKTTITLHYKNNKEVEISDRGIGYIGYNLLRFLSENINDKIRFKTTSITKYLFNKSFKDVTEYDIKTYIRNNVSNIQNLRARHNYDFIHLLRYLYRISLIKGLEREYIKKNLIDKVKEEFEQETAK